MAKAIKKKNTIVINADSIDAIAKAADELVNGKFCEIRSATLKDQLCNYSYELLQGKTKGDTLNRKGVHIVHEDMITQFSGLDVFLAHIDEAFKNANNQTPIQELEAEDILASYKVTGFKLSGVEENKSIILVGYKDVFYGHIGFETPKIKLEGNYLYIEELNQRLLSVIQEVEMYMDGKCAPKLEQQEMEFEDDAEGFNMESGKVEFEEEETQNPV